MGFPKKLINNKLVFNAAVKFLQAKNSRSRLANMVMFHCGRCGSTVLARALEQNREIVWGHEILQNIPHNRHLMGKTPSLAQDVEAFIRARMYRSKCGYYGFDTKAMPELDLSPECGGISLEQLLKILSTNNFLFNILLKRKNYLRRTVSVLKGMQTKQWHSTGQQVSTQKVYLDVENIHVIGSHHKPLLEHFKDIDHYYATLEQLIPKEKLLHLSYEDDIEDDPRAACEKVCSFIGCDYHVPTITMKRTNPFPLEDMIENMDEVARYLKGSKYHWMLEDTGSPTPLDQA